MTTTATEHNLESRIRAIDSELKAEGYASILDPRVLCERLGYDNPRTMHRAFERGDITAFKLGNKWRVRRRELARFIAQAEKRS